MSGFHEPEREADALLLTQLAAAEPAAQARFYDRFAPTLFSLVLKITRDSRLAEQVFRETFAQLPKLAATFDPARISALAWAVMIFRENALQHSPSRPTSDAELAAATDRRGAAEDLTALPTELRERHAMIRAALDQCTPEQRQALELLFFAGLNHEQISERLGAPLDAIKLHVRRTLLRLRESLKEAA